jgi:uncharacterized protein YehS (DUF1456 family)
MNLFLPLVNIMLRKQVGYFKTSRGYLPGAPSRGANIFNVTLKGLRHSLPWKHQDMLEVIMDSSVFVDMPMLVL